MLYLYRMFLDPPIARLFDETYLLKIQGHINPLTLTDHKILCSYSD